MHITGDPRTSEAQRRPGIHAAGQFGLARWSGDTWTLVIDKAALGSGYHALDEVCATDNLLLVTDKGGHVLRRAR